MSALPFSPLTSDGLHALRSDAWDGLAAWACTLAACVSEGDQHGIDQAHREIGQLARQRDEIYASLNVRRDT